MKTIIKILLIAVLFSTFSCGKEFLDIKRDKAQVVPSQIKDFQGMLDYKTTMNSFSSYELSVIGADEYQLSQEGWSSITQPYEKNGYLWNEEVYERKSVYDWDEGYHRILIANMALKGIGKINPVENEKEDWSNVKGSALFFRAINYYQLVQLFCKPYNKNTAKTDLGIPLRLEADITLKVGRGTLQLVYDQIIKDLELAVDLLPEKPFVKYRPSRVAAYALLARVYLQMTDFENARSYADRSLKLSSELIDYNELDNNATYPFSVDIQHNSEILFFISIPTLGFTNSSRFDVNPELLALYHSNDLRRKVYFLNHLNDRKLFKGSYVGSSSFFTGLATDEVILIRAECYARENKTELALDDLNTLLINRYEKDTFIPFSASNSEEVLRLIIDERRKELVLRGVRWEDLRRLNQEPKFQQTLTRRMNGKVYELKPNDVRYVWPIPANEIELGELEQNLR